VVAIRGSNFLGAKIRLFGVYVYFKEGRLREGNHKGHKDYTKDTKGDVAFSGHPRLRGGKHKGPKDYTKGTKGDVAFSGHPRLRGGKHKGHKDYTKDTKALLFGI
jgi:hypothetical protein